MADLVGRFTKLRQENSICWVGRCPHPDHNDSIPSFRLWYKQGRWSWACMACHSDKFDTRHKSYGQDCIAFVRWMSDHTGSKHIKSTDEAVEYLCNLYHIPLERSEQMRLYASMKEKQERYQKSLTLESLMYLQNRGVTDETIRSFHIGYHNGRISFPICSPDGDVIAFSLRTIGTQEGSPKYLVSPNSSIFHKSSAFYGMDHIDMSCSRLYITEGVFDVILSNQYGVHNIISTLGCHLSEDHIPVLQRFKDKEIVLCFDNDAAGIKGTASALSLLKQNGIYARILPLEQGKDMADMALEYKQNFMKYIDMHTVSYWEYILKDPAYIYRTQLNELRRRVIPFILDARNSVTDDNEKELFNIYVKDTFGISL